MAGRFGGCVVTIAVAASGVFVSSSAAAKTRPPSEWVIGAREKVAMIVFDGHARSKKFRTVLRVLDRLNVQASFFVSGRWVRENKQTARRIVRGGHVLGNRGYGRTPFTEMNGKWLRSSLR